MASTFLVLIQKIKYNKNTNIYNQWYYLGKQNIHLMLEKLKITNT